MPRLVACLLALFNLSLIAVPAQAADLRDTATLEAFVDGVVQPLMRNENSPSGVVAISLDGELLLAKGYGYQDIDARQPVDPAETLFRPGSISKLFTWVAVMQLVEQGKLDLDTDVNTYLQGFSIKNTFAEPITLRHILTHTPGFEDGGLGYLIIDKPENLIPLREAMERYQPERVNPPGVQTAYSNYGTALAGLIVEQVSGLPFTEYVQRNLFEPLGMAHSTFAEPLPSDLVPKMAKSYKVEQGAFQEQPFELVGNFGPAGGMSATATDMLRFAQAVLNGGELDGGRILQPDTLTQMLTRNFTHDERLTGMLLGFYESNHNGHRVFGHGGDTQWFHSNLSIDPENRLVVFVSFSGAAGRVPRSALIPAIYDEYFPAEVKVPSAPAGFKERAAPYAGTYAFWRGNFSKVERLFGIGNAVQVVPTEDNTLTVAFGGGAKQYVEVEADLFQERDPGLSLVAGISPSKIAFQRNDAGEVTGFVMDGLVFMSLRKLAFYETPSFHFSLLGISLLVLLLFTLRRFFQRREIAAYNPADRTAIQAAFYAAFLHVLVAVVGAVVIATVMDDLLSGFPTPFKAWLVLPLLATLASLYLAYRTVLVWSKGALAGLMARLRYTVVTLAALALVWFYWYWNILGFQYL